MTESSSKFGTERVVGAVGVISFLLEAGKHHRIAVKVIGVRGNEVIQVMPSEEGQYR